MNLAYSEVQDRVMVCIKSFHFHLNVRFITKTLPSIKVLYKESYSPEFGFFLSFCTSSVALVYYHVTRFCDKIQA